MGIYPWLPTGSEQSVQCGLRVVFIVLTPMVTQYGSWCLVCAEWAAGSLFWIFRNSGVVVIIMLME